MPQATDTAYDRDDRTLTEISEGKSPPKALQGELVVGVRVDDLPEIERERLAGEGKFYPITTDSKGNLRVVTPDGIKVETDELEVLRELLAVMIEVRDLLREIA